jgi:hypothetical protein
MVKSLDFTFDTFTNPGKFLAANIGTAIDVFAPRKLTYLETWLNASAGLSWPFLYHYMDKLSRSHGTMNRVSLNEVENSSLIFLLSIIHLFPDRSP